MDSVNQFLDKINYVSLFNAILKVMGGGWPAWIMAILISVSGIYFLKKVKSWVARKMYNDSQKDIPKTTTDIKEQEGTTSDEWHKAEEDTKKAVEKSPVKREKPHRPAPAETDYLG